MIRTVNLLSLVQAKNLSDDVFDKFKKHHNIRFKSDEVDDLCSLIDFVGENQYLISCFDNFVVGYEIPQIGKEFDLLRFGSEIVINIELKRRSDEEKIKKQLIRNHYYLKATGLKSYHYAYLSESRQLFKLSQSHEIEKVEIKELIVLLQEQVVLQECDVDELFRPVNYLVSPFNSTNRFLAGEYFLTNQQEEVSSTILNQLFERVGPNFISLTGRAGTGKSLLSYHIARKAIETKQKVLIFHVGILNPGHELLVSRGWDIKPIREYSNCNFLDYDLVIIDEAQRLYKGQFESIVSRIKVSRALCIFSFDKLQTLATHENLDIESQVARLNPISNHSLSKKIRFNKEIADFISSLFINKTIDSEISRSKNIFLKFFSTSDDVRKYLDNLDKDEWQQLRFTPSLYSAEPHERYSQKSVPTSHQIIGQEFDNVVVVIDEFFSYNTMGQLVYRARSYYNPRSMLFQNLTRTRKKLLVVIINNEKLLERCMAILG